MIILWGYEAGRHFPTVNYVAGAGGMGDIYAIGTRLRWHHSSMYHYFAMTAIEAYLSVSLSALPQRAVAFTTASVEWCQLDGPDSHGLSPFGCTGAFRLSFARQHTAFQQPCEHSVCCRKRFQWRRTYTC